MYQRTTYTYPSNCTEAQITYGHCLQTQEGHTLSSTVQVFQSYAPIEMSSCLQHNWSINLTQLGSPARQPTPYTPTDLIAPGTQILSSTDIMPESETILRKGNIPEEGGNRGDHNKVGESIAGPSFMDMNPSQSRHIPTTDVTAMMIQQATMDLEHQGINLKPYKDFISLKLILS